MTMPTVTRRQFLKTGAVGLTAFFVPALAGRAARAATPSAVLVVIYMRGGADGLNMVIPAGDPLYYTSRPTIRIPAGTELPLDGFFGLNPQLSDLLPLYAAGELAFIHACGSPATTRSHFLSQSFMERGAPGNNAVKDGWLNRYLAIGGGDRAVAGISLKNSKVRALAGAAPSLAFPRIDEFKLTGNFAAERRAALTARYALLVDTVLGRSMVDALAAIDVVGNVSTATDVVYPTSPTGDPLGAALADAAALIKAEIGVRVIAIDVPGWDHHADTDGAMRRAGGYLAAALPAFRTDLGARTATTLTLCMTEFGRRVKENGAGGSDHGHGTVMMALGGGITGGRVLTRGGQWPGLAPEQLWNGQDLAVTTDFRDVFAEVLHRHLGISLGDCGSILPGFAVDPTTFPGLYA